MNTIDKNLMNQVLQALGWNEQQYAEYIEQTGRAYLNAFIKGYDSIINEITASKTFWNWWKHHWQNRDKEFLDIIETYPEHISSMLDEYTEIHDAKNLADGLYLNGQTLQQSYLNLIDQITKENTKTKTVTPCQI